VKPVATDHLYISYVIYNRQQQALYCSIYY